MRLAINSILLLLILGLIYLLISNIQEPIKFKAEMETRKSAVVDRLMEIRQAQLCYRSITGEFANSFDTLNQVLKTGQFKIINVTGDPDDPDNNEAVIYDTIYRPAFDSIQTLGIALDSMQYVPYTKRNVEFDIQSDTLTYQQTLVHVVEVGTTYKSFMGEYASPKYAKYDNSYDPNNRIKFGNLSAPNTSGNWER